MNATSHTPTFLAVTPYLRYPDGAAAARWLSETFGFGPVKAAEGSENGGWYEGEIAVGGAAVGISGGAETPSGGYLIVAVPDADAMCARIRAAGVDCTEPVDKDYGPRSMSIQDPWGVTWDFWQGEARY